MKGLSEVKKKILEEIWKIEKPATVREISDRVNLKGRSANMHLQLLRKAGLVIMSEGRYAITEKGKEIIGFPKIDRQMAEKILEKASPKNAFHFYLGIGQPLEASSDNLVDFCKKILSVDIRSIEFHMVRGDFESWIRFLGDIELVERLKLIKEANLTGEALRERFCSTLKDRCDELLEKVA